MTNDDGTGAARAMVAQSSLADVMVDRLRAQTQVEIAQGKSITQMLQQSGPMWLKDSRPEQVLAFARVCIGFGLNPLAGEAYLIHGGFYVGIQGRRKAAVRVGGFEGESAPRLLTPEEKEIYGVHEGDVARIIEVWRKGLRLPAVGCGIVRKGEIAKAREGRPGPDGLPFHPLGRDPEGMAAKRAATAAYKRGFPDLDLPTAEADQSMRGRLIDVETGEVVQEAPALGSPVPREGVTVMAGTGPIDADFAEPEVPPAPSLYEVVRRAAVEAFPHGDAPRDAQIDAMHVSELGAAAACEVAAEVWSWPDMDAPLTQVVSRVHAQRARDGQPFASAAITPEDAAALADETPQEPAPTPEPKGRASKAQPKLEV